MLLRLTSRYPVTYLDYIRMVELLQELDFSDRCYIHSILVRHNLDLLDGYPLTRLDVSSQEHGRIGTFTDLLDLCIQVADCKVLCCGGFHVGPRLRDSRGGFWQ